MQYVQIYHCTNVLWDTKMTLDPFGWLMIMNLLRDVIYHVVVLENMIPRHHRQPLCHRCRRPHRRRLLHHNHNRFHHPNHNNNNSNYSNNNNNHLINNKQHHQHAIVIVIRITFRLRQWTQWCQRRQRQSWTVYKHSKRLFLLQTD